MTRRRRLAESAQFAGDLRAAPPRQWHVMLGRQRARQRDDLGPHDRTMHRPLRGRSVVKPLSRSTANRRRQVRTVSTQTLRDRAIPAFDTPWAASRTIWARNRSRYSVRPEATRAANTRSSAPDRTTTYGLDIVI